MDPEPSSPASSSSPHVRWSNHQDVVYHQAVTNYEDQSYGQPDSEPLDARGNRKDANENHEQKYQISNSTGMTYHDGASTSYSMAESTDVSESYRQISLHSYNAVDSEADANSYCQSANNNASSENVSSVSHYTLRQDSHVNNNSPIALIVAQECVSRTNSPASTSTPDSAEAHSSAMISSIHNESMNPAEEMDTGGIGSSTSLDTHLILQGSGSHQGLAGLGNLPILIDRNNLAAYIASVARNDPSLSGLDSSILHHSHRQSTVLTSHLQLSQRGSLLTDQSQFLTNDSKAALSLAHSLLSPLLSQRDLLTPIVTSQPNDSNGVPNNVCQQQQPQSSLVSSFPIHHKHMLAQKYAAELEEGPSTSSGGSSSSLRDSQLRDINHHGHVMMSANDSERMDPHNDVLEVETSTSSAYSAANASAVSNSLFGPVSMYHNQQHSTNHHDMNASSSVREVLPMDVYGLDRGVSLVSSTRDGPEDLMEHQVDHYDSPIHHHSHQNRHVSDVSGSVHSYVSSTVDLMTPTQMRREESRMNSAMNAKLRGQDEVVDSSDNYDHHAETSEGLLHSTTHGFLNSIEDLQHSPPEDEASSTVLTNHRQLGSNSNHLLTDASSSSHLLTDAQLVEHAETLEELQCCGVVSSASHPDSSRVAAELMATENEINELDPVPGTSQQQLEDIPGRPKRDLKTGRIYCGQFYEKECMRHRIQLIFDKPVLSRAWASLPATYLYVNKIALLEDGETIYGVFAKKTIPKRTQFGPIEGVHVKRHDKLPRECFNLLVEEEENTLIYLDTEDESLSNWMRFVRPAENHKEQNLILVQQGQNLYFNTTRPINPKTELRVWYSPAYAERWNLTVLEPDEEERRALEELENGWPCFECNKRFTTSDELQKHLNQHDDDETIPKDDDEDNIVKIKAAKAKVKSVKSQKVFNQQETQNNTMTALDCLNDATQAALARKSKPDATKTDMKCESSGCLSDQTSDPLLKRVPAAGTRLTDKSSTSSSSKTSSTSKPEEFECEICNKLFPRNYSLQRHLIMHSGEKKFKCPICDMEFSHVYNRNRHVRRHRERGENEASKRPAKSLAGKKKKLALDLTCSQCKLLFPNSIILNLHNFSHKFEDLGDLLGEGFSKMNDSTKTENESNELAQFMEKGTYKCPECVETYSNKRELVDHARIHGKPLLRNGKPYLSNHLLGSKIGSGKPYKCNLCYKAFATDDRLIRHYLVHGSEDSKPLQCTICLKRFLNNSALSCHIKVHSEEKKYFECPICKTGFNQITFLKDHVHTHSNKGTYTCPHCQKDFDEYNQIRKHIRAFHSDRRYPCVLCDKIFPRPDKLKLHMLRHSDHREFLCAHCGKQFKRKDKLKEHMKRMHGPERENKVVKKTVKESSNKKFVPKVSPTDYHRFIYKCHTCLLGFKRRGMLVNHLAKRHPDIPPDTVPELNFPILKTTRDYYCQYCEKVYKSSSKRKSHILRNHPGAELPMSNRRKGGLPEVPGVPNPTFSQTVGSITTHPHHCNWCHKQYASKAKLLQHQRKKHLDLLIIAKANKSSEIIAQPLSPLPTPSISTVTTVNTSSTSEVIPVVINHATQIGNFSESTVIIDGMKRKIQFIKRDLASPNTVSNSVTADILPSADLLTQAMSELTQTLTEFRTTGGDFLTTRLSNAETFVLRSSPSSTSPSRQTPPPMIVVSNSNVGQSKCLPEDENNSHEDIQQQSQTIMQEGQSDAEPTTLDPNQITQLLAHYQQQPLSPQAIITTSESSTGYSQRSCWPMEISSTNIVNYSQDQ